MLLWRGQVGRLQMPASGRSLDDWLHAHGAAGPVLFPRIQFGTVRRGQRHYYTSLHVPSLHVTPLLHATTTRHVTTTRHYYTSLRVTSLLHVTTTRTTRPYYGILHGITRHYYTSRHRTSYNTSYASYYTAYYTPYPSYTHSVTHLLTTWVTHKVWVGGKFFTSYQLSVAVVSV